MSEEPLSCKEIGPGPAPVLASTCLSIDLRYHGVCVRPWDALLWAPALLAVALAGARPRRHQCTPPRSNRSLARNPGLDLLKMVPCPETKA